MADLTFVIPVGPMHTDIVQQAIASVDAQTIPCEIIVIYDRHSRGAGWARNQGLSDPEVGEYISFLDADDVLEPDFAECALQALDHYAQMRKGGVRYAYTDWYGHDGKEHKAADPCVVWTENTNHLVTAVVPTAFARAIGGFDEAMQGVEDADFYMRLRIAGLCGLHVNAPLLHYRAGGQRSLAARKSGEETRSLHYMATRYGGYNLMGCCGDSTPGPVMPNGEPNEGDILVQAQWMGNMQKRGLATGTIYARTSYPKYLYVNEKDAALSPNLFKRVSSPLQASNGIVLQPAYKPEGVSWQATAEAMFGGGVQPVASKPIEYKPHGVGKKKSDVVKQAQEWSKIEGSDL